MEATPAGQHESDNATRLEAERTYAGPTHVTRADIARYWAPRIINRRGVGSAVEARREPLLLDSALECDFCPTEAEYGGMVQLLLEDAAREPAQEFVLASRDWLANALDNGIEPAQVVQYVIEKY